MKIKMKIKLKVKLLFETEKLKFENALSCKQSYEDDGNIK